MLLNLSTGLLILNFLLFIFKIFIGFQIYWLSIMIYLFPFFKKKLINCFSFKFLVPLRHALNTCGFSYDLLTFLGYQIPCQCLAVLAGCELWV